jgi:hypothetical protein
MRSTTVYRRFYTTESAGTAITVDLPGFGTPKACLIYYLENSAINDAFDTSLQFRTMGIGMIGSTDSSVTSALTYRSCFTTQMNAMASAGTTISRRQHSISRYLYVPNTAGTILWQASSASFTTDQATFTPSASTPQTNGHVDCIMTFFTGDDLTVAIGDSSFPGAAPGTRAYSQLSFQPDLVLVASTIVGRDAGVQDDARLSFGAATRLPALQKGVSWHMELGGVGVNNLGLGALASSSVMISYGSNLSTGPGTDTISAITTGGWTFTEATISSGTTNAYNFMAFKTNSPTDIALVDVVSNTTTGDLFTGLGSSGFVPQTVIGALTNNSVDNTRNLSSPDADGIFLFAGNNSNHSVFYNGIGTISTSNVSSTVTGVNTEFLRLAPGYRLYQTDGTLIGTVSTAASKLSLTLTSTAANTLSAGTSYLYTQPGQYCAAFGNSDNTTSTQILSGIATTLIANARGVGANPVRLELGNLTNFDTRPGFNVNTSLASGTARRGFAVAFKSEQANRRRGQTS